MKIANITHQPLSTEPETIKPTSSNRPSAETAGEKLEEAAVANKSSLPAFQKPPVDDPLSKARLLDKLGAGNSGTAPSGPEIRMKDNNVDWTDEPGADLPGEDRNIGDASEKDPGGSNRDVGFSLSAPSRFEGDGRTKLTSGQGSGTTTNASTQSNTPSSSGTSSGSTQSSTTGSTSVHKKK
jgi:hypothetical protein